MDSSLGSDRITWSRRGPLFVGLVENRSKGSHGRHLAMA
jgi:hypothetical protein